MRSQAPKIATTFFLLATLAACGGSATGPVEEVAYEFTDYTNLLSDYPTAGRAFTLVSDLPTTAVDYVGFARLEDRESGAAYLGVMDLTVDFDDSTEQVYGTIDQFAQYSDGSGETFTTAMIATDGSFDVLATLSGSNSSLNAFSGSASGTLGGVGDTLKVSGHFHGADANVVVMEFGGIDFAGDGLAEQDFPDGGI